MILFKTVFFITSLFLCFIIGFILYSISKTNSSLKKTISIPVIIALIAIILYTIFSFCDYYKWAMLFNTIYYCCTDWLVFTMLLFISEYTEISINKTVKGLLFSLCIIDCISLFVNLFTLHSFDLILLYFGNNYPYWGVKFTSIHSLHLGFCYFLVVTTFVMLIYSSVKAPSFYKRKYIFIFIAYFLEIIINCICYTFNTPIDFSVILYAVLAGFIYYFALCSFPNQIMNFLLETINDKIDDGILFFNEKERFLYANNVMKNIFCDDKGRFSPAYAEEYLIEWQNKHPEAETKSNDSFEIAGREHHFMVQYQTLYFDKQKLGAFFKFVDITDKFEQYIKERYIATHDELTGLYNRTGFFAAVEKVQKNIQLKEKCSYIMISSNIKDFKFINGIFGEKFGDELLKQQAEAMRKFADIDSVLGRIGDDKFAIFIKKEFFNERFIKEKMEESFYKFDTSFKLRFEIGYYESRYAGESPHVMCDKATMACEQLSNDYKNMFSKYDSNLMDKVLVEKTITNDFEKALKNSQFTIFIQPQIAKYGTEKEIYFGASTSARWIHPSKGIIEPEVFIPILEKTGLIYKLDKYIWEISAKKVKEWTDKGFENTSISINISSKDQYYIDISKTLINIVNDYGIKPNQLNIEISETDFMENFEKSTSLLESLKNYGFKVVISNFGSGYSSLNMLKDINVDALKIDRVFLKEDENRERSHTILKSIINMAKALNIEVLMEGVKTKENVELLQSFGCDTFQGSYFSAPLPLEEFERSYL